MFSSPLRFSKYKKSYLPKSNLSKQKSKSLFRMDEYSEDYSGSGINLTRETSQVIKKTAKTAVYGQPMDFLTVCEAPGCISKTVAMNFPAIDRNVAARACVTRQRR